MLKFLILILFVITEISARVCNQETTSKNEELLEHEEKTRTFYDYNTHIIAYKDLHQSKCYLERMQEGSRNTPRKKITNSALETYFISDIQLTKHQIWRLAGSRITEFCRGFPTYLLQERKSSSFVSTDDLNELNDGLPTTRKHQIQRIKRENTAFFRGRNFRGQTQSQYLNYGGNGQQPGKAEAESTLDGSRAVVTGNSGMGQAQSQSGIAGGCGDCYGDIGRYDSHAQGLGYSPDHRGPSAQVGPGQLTTGTGRPSGLPQGPDGIPRLRPGQQNGLRPGQIPSIGFQPGQLQQGTSDYLPGQLIRGQLQPGQLLPGQLQPGQLLPGQISPGQLTPGQLLPGQLMPGQMQPDQLPPGQLMPGQMQPGQLPPGQLMPGHVQPGQFMPGQLVPGQVQPGQFPSGQIQPGQFQPGQLAPGHIQSGQLAPGQFQPGQLTPGQMPSGQLIHGQTYPGQLSPGQIQPSQIVPGLQGPGQIGMGSTFPGQLPSGQYPGTQIPGQFPGVQIPGAQIPGQYPSTGKLIPSAQISKVPGDIGREYLPRGPDDRTSIYPGKITAETLITIHGTHGGQTYPGQYQDHLPGAQISSRQPTGQYPTGQVPVTQIPGQYPGGPISGQYPGVQIPGQYPDTQITGTQVPTQYPGTQITGQYPGAQIPGQYPGAHIPGQLPSGQHTGQYPGAQIPGQYPGAQIPGQYPGAQIPGQYPDSQIPGQYPGAQISGQYPGAQIPGQLPSGQLPGAQLAGQYPGVQIPGQFPAAQIPGQYPGAQIPGQYPGAQIPGQYPGVQIPGQYPGTQILGQYPGAQIPGQYPGAQIPGQYPGAQIPGQYPGAQISGQYPGTQIPGHFPGAQIPGQYPGAQIPGQYPGVQIPGEQYTGTGQYPVGPSAQIDGRPTCIPGQQCIDGDDGTSQAQSSVHQINNKTQAQASAQGQFMSGSAQSQVSGTYSGSGSFSAQAGTIDGKRGAQTQVSGGADGATSSAQGNGGSGQSQSQVQYYSETGGTISNAQSSGFNHGSNTQVQASEKGGMADAQANGPGSTSSQAQIGFTPHEENETDNQGTPFRGGGTANAQSGSYTGQSQAQIQGKFRYGIRYVGAAQAGTGTKESLEELRKNSTLISDVQRSLDLAPIKFSETNSTKFSRTSQSKQFSGSSVQANKPSPKPSNTGVLINMDKQPEIDSQMKIHHLPSSENKQEVTSTPPFKVEPENQDDYDDYDDEDDEDYDNTTEKQNETPMSRSISQTTPTQKQTILLGPLENVDAHIIQAKGDRDLPTGMILQPGQTIPGTSGYQIPQGYRGRVTSSVAHGDKTIAFGKDSQAQSVTITPGTGKIHYIKPGYRTNTYYKPNNQASTRSLTYPKFLSVTTSESGSKNAITGKKNPQVFYTQSSTCGFFTNTCVYSGARKICLPKARSNPDGTPMLC